MFRERRGTLVVEARAVVSVQSYVNPNPWPKPQTIILVWELDLAAASARDALQSGSSAGKGATKVARKTLNPKPHTLASLRRLKKHTTKTQVDGFNL